MPTPTATLFLNDLAQKKDRLSKTFRQKHHVAYQYLTQEGSSIQSLRDRSAKLLTSATLSGVLLLSAPQVPLWGTGNAHIRVLYQTLSEFLKRLEGNSKLELSTSDEQTIEENIKKFYGVNTAFVMDNHRLPSYYGLIGLEQHLPRRPGDTASQHDEYPEVGMATSRGAFGYFDEPGKNPQKVIEQEKYYIVLQTFTVKEWNSEWQILKPWYKFRKFLVINPENGTAVVAILGDSGPGVQTGKQFGGSPEVMAALGYYPKMAKGNVIVLFLDDPEDRVPLGSLSVKGE